MDVGIQAEVAVLSVTSGKITTVVLSPGSDRDCSSLHTVWIPSVSVITLGARPRAPVVITTVKDHTPTLAPAGVVVSNKE